MAEYTGSRLQASIIPTLYKKAYLEKHSVDITDYAKAFCAANRKYGKSCTRHDIEWYWEGNIRREFDVRPRKPKKRKTGPSSRDDTVNEEHSVSTQKERRVSLGDFHVRTFDKDSTLDAGLKTILKHTYILPPHATTELHENAAPESSTKARGGESEESMVDPGQRRTRDLEKQLSELKVAESELEYKYQSEKGMRMGAEERISRLLVDLKESQDLVAQLEKQPPKVV